MTASTQATARVLFAGVVLSFLLLSAGLIVFFLPSGIPATPLFEAGLITLMATPLARLVVLGIEFVRRREYAFALIALGVVFLLGVSVYIGFA